MTTTIQTQTNSDIVLPWQEFISLRGVTHKLRWMNDGSQVEFVIDSNWSNRAGIRKQILGYSKAYGGIKDPAMNRFLPCRYPDSGWMFATSVTMEGVNWTNKFATVAPAALGPVSGYDLNRTYITFSTLPFDVRLNNDPAIIGKPTNAVDVYGGIIAGDGTNGVTIPGGAVVPGNGS